MSFEKPDDTRSLDSEIVRLQKSTRTTLPAILPLHDVLRQKYHWYYDWHLMPGVRVIHTFVLLLFLFFTATIFYQFIISQPKAVMAATVNKNPISEGDLTSWTKTGGTLPGILTDGAAPPWDDTTYINSSTQSDEESVNIATVANVDTVSDVTVNTRVSTAVEAGVGVYVSQDGATWVICGNVSNTPGFAAQSVTCADLGWTINGTLSLQVKFRKTGLDARFADISDVDVDITYVSQLPTAPTIGTAAAQSTTSIRWNFTDNASNETGFKVHDSSHTVKATCATANLTYCDETSLSANTNYTRHVVAYNANGDSTDSGNASRFTLASVPAAATFGASTSSSLTVILPNGDATKYAFGIDQTCSSACDGIDTNKWVGADGVADEASAVYQSRGAWGGDSGIVVSGLSASTTYYFRSSAENGNSVANPTLSAEGHDTTDAAGITISGTVYTNEAKSGNIGNCTNCIGLSVNGAAKSTANATAGAFSFSGVTVAANNTIALFIDDNASYEGTLITQAVNTTDNITGLEMYTNKVVLRHETAGPMTNVLLDTANNSGDTDIHYSGTTTITFDTGYELWIDNVGGGKTYTPGNPMVADDIEIRSGSTLNTAANAVTVNGSFLNSGTLTTSGTFTFAAGATGKTIASGSSHFNNLTFNNANGGWTFNNAQNIDGDFTVTAASAITLGAYSHTMSGNVSLAGTTFTTTGSTIVMNGTTKNLSGNGKALNNLTISSSITAVTAASNNFYVNGTLLVTTGNSLTINNSVRCIMNGGSATATIQNGATVQKSAEATPTGRLDFYDTATVSTTGTLNADSAFYASSTSVVVPNRTYGGTVYLVHISSNSGLTITLGTTADAMSFSALNVQTASTGNLSASVNANNPPVNITGALYATRAANTTVSLAMGTGTWTIGGSFSVNGLYASKTSGDVNITGGLASSVADSTLAMGSGNWTVGGNVVLTNITVTANTSTLAMSGTSKTLTTNNQTLNNYKVLNSSGSNQTVAVSGTLNVGGNLNVEAAGGGEANLDCSTNNPTVNITGNIDFTGVGAGSEDIHMGTGTWTVSGNVDLTDGTITSGTSTLAMNGVAKNLIGAGRSLYNLTISGTITATTSDVIIAMNGTLTVDNSKQLTVDTGRTVTISSNATTTLNGTIVSNTTGLFKLIDGACGKLGAGGTLSANVQFTATAGSVTVPQRTYGGPVTLVSTSTAVRQATFGTAAGQTLNFSSSLTVNPTNSGYLRLVADTFNPTINVTGDVSMNKPVSGVPSIQMGSGTWAVSGNVNFTDGTVTIPDYATQCVALGNPCLLLMNGSSKALTTNAQTLNNIDFNSAGTITLNDTLSTNGYFKITAGTINATNRTLNIAGDFNHAGGTFTSIGSTVNLNGADGANQLVHGSTSFNNFSAVATGNTVGRTLTFDGGSTTTVGGTFTITGGSGKVISLKSSNGSNWNLAPAAASVSYAYAQKSTSSIPICAGYSYPGGDGGDNSSWYFTSDGTCVPKDASTLDLTNLSTSGFDLSWVDNATTEDFYKVFLVERAAGNCDTVPDWGAPYATLGADIITEPIVGQNTNTRYCMAVSANSTIWGDSAKTYSTPTYTKIETPTGITATADSTSQISVSVTNALSNLDTGLSGLQFTEIQSNPGGGGQSCFTDWAQTNSCQDTGLTANTLYRYEAKARNGDGVQTDAFSFTQKYTLIETPTTITAGLITPNSIALNISDSLTNIDTGSSGIQYEETSGNTGGGGETAFTTWPQTTGTTDVSLKGAISGVTGTSYKYKIKARNAEGAETPQSAEFEFTTTAGTQLLFQLPGETIDETGDHELTYSDPNPSSIVAGNPFDITVYAADGSDYRDLSHEDTIALSTLTDPLAEFPVGVPMANGSIIYNNVVFKTVGNHVIDGLGSGGSSHEFAVVPGICSAGVSTVAAAPASLDVGQTSTVTVYLKDAFGNVLAGHSVGAGTNQVGDNISFSAATTDANGRIYVYVTSAAAHVSTVTITDTTDAVVLTTKPQITFNELAEDTVDNPTNFTISAGNAQASLSWTNPASFDHINIYRSLISGALGVNIKETSGTSFTDTGLTNGTTYYYTLKAEDNSGNLSSGTAQLSATPQTVSTPTPTSSIVPSNDQAPTTPTNLRATSITDSSVNFIWDPSIDDVGVVGYEVYNADSKVIIGQVSDASFSRSGLSPETTYRFMVRAFDTAGNYSDYSEALSITTEKNIPGDEDNDEEGIVAFLVMGNVPKEIDAGKNFPKDIRVTAADAGGKIRTDYNKAVYFSSTDNKAKLENNKRNPYSFNAQDAGIHLFDKSGFNLETVGKQKLSVSDNSTSSTLEIMVLSSGIINVGFEKAGEEIVDFFSNPNNISNLNIGIITATSLLLLTPLLINVLTSLSNLIPQLTLWYYQLLELLGMRRRRKNWGVVFNSKTSQAIPLAVIRIYDKKYDRILEQAVADQQGRYGLLVKEGTFYIKTIKAGFSFPPKDKNSVFYEKIYSGGEFKIAGKDLSIIYNIPMDPFTKPGFMVKIWVVFIKASKWLQKLVLPLFFVGLVINIIILIMYFNLFYVITFIFYVLVGILEYLKTRKARPYGRVTDVYNKSIQLAIVRIYRKRNNRLIETDVTDKDGRFKFLVTPGVYYITASKPGYVDFKSHLMYLQKEQSLVTTSIKLKKEA